MCRRGSLWNRVETMPFVEGTESDLRRLGPLVARGSLPALRIARRRAERQLFGSDLDWNRIEVETRPRFWEVEIEPLPRAEQTGEHPAPTYCVSIRYDVSPVVITDNSDPWIRRYINRPSD